MLDRAKAALLAAYDNTRRDLPPDEVDRRRDTFLTSYSPELLANLRGDDLMAAVHGDGPRTGLFYDLEFANLYAPFGSIGGGSALKFKLFAAGDGSGFRRKGPHNRPAPCTDAEAERMTADIVAMLLTALRAAEECGLPAAEPARWLEFERTVTTAIPASLTLTGHDSPVALLGWAHKFLAICRPDVFSFHHQSRQLANHLVRLGEAPDAGESRYRLDHQWYRLRTGDPDLRACHPALLMNAAYDAFGGTTRYWRIRTDEHDEHGLIDRWPHMRDAGRASIGWSFLGDLRDLVDGEEGRPARERIEEALTLHEENIEVPALLIGRWACQIHDFYAAISPGDRMVALTGGSLVGVGEVTSGYEYDSRDAQPHYRRIRWHDMPAEPVPNPSGRHAALVEFTRRYAEAARVERLLLSSEPLPESAYAATVVREDPPPPLASGRAGRESAARLAPQPLDPFQQRVRSILERKGQVILYGPPGTGKTYRARQTAQELVAGEIGEGRPWAALRDRDRRIADASIEAVTFHPAYAYEDFIEGYRPIAAPNGGPAFELRDGLFLQFCDHAREHPGQHHILLIDEINRGNVAAIMGELITLLESDKRDNTAALLPLSRRRFLIPGNVWIIGTMNTADRSISHLDAALRRRFGFVECLPEPGCIDVQIDRLSLSALLEEINGRIRAHLPRNARELQIGHAYFMRDGRPIGNKQALQAAIRDDVLPLLAEYCFESYAGLARILGDELIDAVGQVPNEDVLANPDLLHRALLNLVSGESVRRTDRAGLREPDRESDLEGLDDAPLGGHSAGIRRRV